MSFDWRKEFERQHGQKPGDARHAPRERPAVAADGEIAGAPAGATATLTDAPTATAAPEVPASVPPAPAKASDLPAAEATAGGATMNPCGPAEIIREPGESGAPNFERVEIAPNQFVNLTAARQLGLVK